MTVHVLISGRVQGVGFRHFTKTNADDFGVKGWVKNLDNGKVEAVFEGKESDVQALIGKIKAGPAFGKVSEIETEQTETGNYKKFEVRYE